jgi:hypothetical protein
VKAVRTRMRPERHFADSFATVRVSLLKKVKGWVKEYLGGMAKKRGHAKRREPGVPSLKAA